MEAEIINPRLGKAQEALRAADVLLRGGAWDAVINRAYYAGFHAAVGYLQEKTAAGPGRGGRWSHTYVIQKFRQCTATEGQDLRDLYQARTVADYTISAVGELDAKRAIEMGRKIFNFCMKALTPGPGTPGEEVVPSEAKGEGHNG